MVGKPLETGILPVKKRRVEGKGKAGGKGTSDALPGRSKLGGKHVKRGFTQRNVGLAGSLSEGSP